MNSAHIPRRKALGVTLLSFINHNNPKKPKGSLHWLVPMHFTWTPFRKKAGTHPTFDAARKRKTVKNKNCKKNGFAKTSGRQDIPEGNPLLKKEPPSPWCLSGIWCSSTTKRASGRQNIREGETSRHVSYGSGVVRTIGNMGFVMEQIFVSSFFYSTGCLDFLLYINALYLEQCSAVKFHANMRIPKPINSKIDKPEEYLFYIQKNPKF